MHKTPDEIKKGLECCRNLWDCKNKDCPYLGDGCYPKLHEDIKTLNQQLETQVPRWISVEERLPEKGQKVAFIPNFNPRAVYVGEISHVGRQGGVMFENSFSRTTMGYYASHWMPLPEPPKEPEA